jgi:hypothetical protein
VGCAESLTVRGALPALTLAVTAASSEEDVVESPSHPVVIAPARPATAIVAKRLALVVYFKNRLTVLLTPIGFKPDHSGAR